MGMVLCTSHPVRVKLPLQVQLETVHLQQLKASLQIKPMTWILVLLPLRMSKGAH